MDMVSLKALRAKRKLVYFLQALFTFSSGFGEQDDTTRGWKSVCFNLEPLQPAVVDTWEKGGGSFAFLYKQTWCFVALYLLFNRLFRPSPPNIC